MCWEHIGCAWNISLSHLNMSGLTRLCLYINWSCLDISHIWIQYVWACVVHVWVYLEMAWSSKGFVWISLDVLGTFVKHVSDKSGLCLDITEMIEHAWKISDMYQPARNISGYFGKTEQVWSMSRQAMEISWQVSTFMEQVLTAVYHVVLCLEHVWNNVLTYPE